MKNNVSNLSFTSNIKFVSRSEYIKIADSGIFGPKFVHESWDPSKVRRITDRGGSEGIIYCISGVIEHLQNKRLLLSHWFPKKIVKDNEECKNFAAKIKASLEKISSLNNFKGVFFGGISKDFPEEHKLSKNLLSFFKKNFKISNKKDYTLFLFQDAKGVKTPEDWPQLHFIYSKKNDTYYVNCRKAIDGKLHDLPLNKESIRDHFGVILPSNRDKIFIENEQIPNQYWTKFKKSDLVDFY